MILILGTAYVDFSGSHCNTFKFKYLKKVEVVTRETKDSESVWINLKKN